ncbi:MAG: tetratricopeptide repeat protein [Balneolaceae bacterium]
MGIYKKIGYILTISLFLIWTPVLGQSENELLIQRIDSINALYVQQITNNTTQTKTLLLQTDVLADSIGYQEGRAKILAKLALVSGYLGDWDESVTYRLESINLFEELGMLLQAGYGFAELGYGTRRRSYERAEYFMRRGIQILQDFPQSVELSDAYNNYGVVKLDQQQIDSAIYFMEKSLAIKIANKDTLGISYSYGNLGTAYHGAQQYERAIQYLQQAFDIKKGIPDSIGMGIDLTNLGSAFDEKGDYEAALRHYKASLNMALQIKYPHLAEHNFSTISNLYEIQGRYDSALHYQKKFSEFKDERLNETTQHKLNELEVQFESEQKEKELALKQAELSQEKLKVRQRNWILSALGALFMTGLFISGLIFRQQNIKSENLKRENKLKIQLANAEVENKIHQERERISRDLHDNVGSQISSLITGIEISNIHLKKNQPEEAIDILNNLDTDARWAMTELRETIWLLDKDEIPINAFLDHLKNYLRRQKRYIGDIITSIQADVNDSLILNPTQSLNLMRIIQEALNNTNKYARASEFEIQLCQSEHALLLTIQDNGIGMNLEKQQNIGNGLTNMKQRCDEIKAEFKISSSADNGTFIQIILPNIP